MAEQGYSALRIAKLATNKVQDQLGFTAAMEAACADYRPMSRPAEPVGTKSPNLVGMDSRAEGKTSLKAGETRKGKN